MASQVIRPKDIRVMSMLRRLAGNVPPVAAARISAAISIKNNILAIGNNQAKTCPFQARFGKNPESIFVHAEINVIKQALNHCDVTDFRKATLYIARVRRPDHKQKIWVDGTSCPCSGCVGAITEFGIRRVIHTTDIHNEFALINF